MQVAGQAQVGYTFDNANRLTQIAQGTSTVGLTYDNANRHSTLTLPNGIVATYSYDNDSHLTGISYALNSNPVGVLNYGYDAIGMQTSISGSMARMGLPQPMPSAAYDGGNELLAWNESAFSYDSNGNMLSDGVHNYAWDARNHLSTIDSGSTGSFVYDPAGRRATKVISGTQTNFLYDVANPVQELSGSTPTANLLTGGLDEYFMRTDTNGTWNFLTDALDSTAALSDPTGAIQTQYTFDPFGNTAQSGTSTTNSFAYTGRESDGTGLYFYRARYYSPQLGRFISEDPVGFGGGINVYGYVGDSPTNAIDPTGLAPVNPQDMASLEGLFPGFTPLSNTGIVVPVPCDEVRKILEQNNFYSSDNWPNKNLFLFWDPIAHSGGWEFRKKDGMHLRMKYPDKPCDKTCTLDQAHNDDYNPMFDPGGHFLYELLPDLGSQVTPSSGNGYPVPH